MELEKSLLGGTPPPRRSRRLYWGFFGPFIAGISLGGHDALAPGKERWTFTTGDTVYSSPALNSDTVFVGSSDANFYAIATV